MATVTFQGNPVNTCGDVPEVGSKAPDAVLVKTDLSECSIWGCKGTKRVFNIFPSLDTPVCATAVRTFNKKAAACEDTVVVCISKDLPFAQARFCGAEGIENVVSASGFRSDFGSAYGVEAVDTALKGLYVRCVIVLDEEGVVKYVELVDEITNEPNYDAALEALK